MTAAMENTFASAYLQAIPNPVLTIGENDRLTYANQAAEQFFQLSSASLSRLALKEVIPFASPLSSLIEQVRATGAVVNEYEVHVGTPKTGGERSVDLQAAPIPEQPGAVVVMLLHRAMAQKIGRQLSHRDAARSVAGMAAILAHEIKNPLSGIRGAAQLIEPHVDDADRELAKLICAETDRIRDLVDQMEAFSDERLPEREAVNIHAVLDHVKNLAEPGIAAGINIREDYDPSLPYVYGNRDQLIQVVLNLVKNAAEAISGSGHSGDITLSTAYRSGVRLGAPGTGLRTTLPLEFCVRNSGPEIPETLRANLFDPFVTSKSGGRGLGLALVAKIIRDHGGIVECISEPDLTTFRVLLPKADGNAVTGR